MQKPTRPSEKNPGLSDRAYKPWPLDRESDGHEKSGDTGNLHARFNPRLVGFGIVSPSIGASDRAKDGSPTFKDLQEPCSRNPEEHQ